MGKNNCNNYVLSITRTLILVLFILIYIISCKLEEPKFNPEVSGSADDTKVSILSPNKGSGVNSTNVTNFKLSGKCSESGLNVEVTVHGLGRLATPCRDGRWSTGVNLSSASQGKVDISVEHRDLAENTPAKDATHFFVDTVIPQVNQVYSTNVDNTYINDQLIEIKVAFSEDVILSGVSGLKLNSTATAFYSSGSGSSILTYNYTIGAGEDSNDLDYSTATSLYTLGSIQDGAGNNAILTLASPGSANSISDDQTIIVSTTPRVIDVTSLNVDNVYNATDTATIQVTFSETVSVTGTPKINLNSGITASALYNSGNGTSSLLFLYDISPGDNVRDLDYVATGSLTLSGGDSIKDALNRDANLTLPTPGEASSLGNNKNIIIDTVPIIKNVTSTASGVYDTGSEISIQIEFSENVEVTGSSELALSSTGTAYYSSGSGSNILNYIYTVASNQDSNDLDYASTGSLSGNIVDVDIPVEAANLTLPSPGSTGSLGFNESITVKSTPTVLNITSTATSPKTLGDEVLIQMVFSDNVNVTGSPLINLNSGTTASAYYVSGSGSNTLNFKYIVGPGDQISELGYSATGALTSGTIRDSVSSDDAIRTLPVPGENGSLRANTDIAINTPPIVLSVTSSNNDISYDVGDIISIQIEFSEDVIVTGVPWLALNTGTTATALYSTGSGSNILTFNYTVAAGEDTNDLDYDATDSLTLNGGSISDGTYDADRTLPAPGSAGSLGNNKNITVASLPRISNVYSSMNGTYKNVGQNIDINVTFDEVVDINTTLGTPYLSLDSSTTATATYVSGDNTNTLTFTYVVKEGENSLDLNYQSTSSLVPNGGTVQDLSANSAVLLLPALNDASSLKGNNDLVIDTAPQVVQVSSTKANGSYSEGTNIVVLVEFTEQVFVTGRPELSLQVGPTSTATAYFSGGAGTNSLEFDYLVEVGHNIDDLEYSSTSALVVAGGTIKDQDGDDAILDLPTISTPGSGSLADNKDIEVDTRVGIENVTSANADGAGNPYAPGGTIDIQVTFTATVMVSTVSGTPSLTMGLDAERTGTALYTSGSGSSTLTFRYTVGSLDNSTDLDYQSINALNLNGGTIVDTIVPQNANLKLPAVGAVGSLSANKDLVVESDPIVTEVSSPSPNQVYNEGFIIFVDVVFNENINYSGTPQLTLETGFNDGITVFDSIQGGYKLRFKYTVKAGDYTSDLDYTATSSLTINGGNITAVDNGNPASSLDLPVPGAANSLSNSSDIIIETSPIPLNVTSSATGFYNIGNTIVLQVNFSEPVNVTGTPQFIMDVGTTASAIYNGNGNGTDTLEFEYTVAAGHHSSDLDYGPSNVISGTIKDLTGVNVSPNLPTPGGTGSLATNRNIKIDTIPLVKNITSNTSEASVYDVGSVINVQVQFTEPVEVITATPYFIMNAGTNATAFYTSGSGTDTLLFQYTVAAEEDTTDLDTANTTLTLNGATIQDQDDGPSYDSFVAGVGSLPTPGATGSLGANKNLQIASIPTVTDVSVTNADNTYSSGNTILVDITFTEKVNVTGTPLLVLNSGATASASYTSGSGSYVLRFNYPIGDNDNTPVGGELDYSTTNSLVLNSGTINDLAGNPANRTLPTIPDPGSISNDHQIIVDNDPRVINVNATTVDGTYREGQPIDIEVEFTEPISVTGTPYLVLNVGGTATALATYQGVSGSKINFQYAIGIGHYSNDLEYAATDSLKLMPSSTIKDTDVGLANAILTLPSLGTMGSLAYGSAIKIDTSPAIVEVRSTSPDNTYTVGQLLNFELEFTENVAVTGTPQLFLNSGANTIAYYSGGTGTNTLQFQYTVQAGENSADLDYSSTGSLVLPGGVSIKEVSSEYTAVLTLASPGTTGSISDDKEIKIDTPPIVTDIRSVSNGTFGVGSPDIDIQVTFSEEVEVNTASGTPYLNLDSTASAFYTSGSPNTTLNFTYSIGAGEDSFNLDALSMDLNSGTLTDRDFTNDSYSSSPFPTGTNTGSLKNNNSIIIRTIPVVENVTSTATGEYSSGDIYVDVVFSEIVNVTGTPTMVMDLVGTDATAYYDSGSGSTTLKFKYSIGATDNTTLLPAGGLEYIQDSLVVDIASLIQDPATNNADLTTLPDPWTAGSLGTNTNIVINTAASIIDVDSISLDQEYNLGGSISIQVQFSEIVDVTGTPTLSLDSTGTAFYSAGTGSDTLTFSYTIGEGEDSDDLKVDSLNVPPGSIVDNMTTAVNTAMLTDALKNKKDIIVLTTPTIKNVTSSKADNAYDLGTLIPVQIEFSEKVNVSASANLTLALNAGTTATVSYSSGSGSKILEFNYTVATGENTPALQNLDYSATGSLTLASGTVQDLYASNPRTALLTLPTPGGAGSLAANKNIKVDTTPSIINVTSSDANQTFSDGEVVNIQVQFTENVEVSGTPVMVLLELNSGTTASATLTASSSGTNTLNFSYTVLSGENSDDLDYDAPGSLTITSGTITDEDNTALGLQNANLTLASPGAEFSLGYNKDIVIDCAPYITNVTSSKADGTYIVGEIIPIDITFSENVNVTGTPQITLNSGSSNGGIDRWANYTSGDSTNVITFNYIVGEGDNTTDLSYTSSSAITLNGGTIKDIITLPSTDVPHSALLPLPNPGSTNSLSDNKDIIIKLLSITGGSDFSCGLTYTVGQCWGNNNNGRLGDDSSTDSQIPVNVPGLSDGNNVIQISSHGAHSCAVVAGAAKCWGKNVYGQVGDGTTIDKDMITTVSGLTSGVMQVGSGTSFSCALLNSGLVKCWGRNNEGQLGNNSTVDSSTPVTVQNDGAGDLTGVYQVAVGGSHACAIINTGEMKCWGDNQYGQLGDGTNDDKDGAVSVSGVSIDFIEVDLGEDHTCAILIDGSAKCWGKNSTGQVGDNSTTNQNVPTSVIDLDSGIIGITAGGAHSCALLSSKQIKCWGAGSFGQLGNNGTTSMIPDNVVNKSSANITTGAIVAAGNTHTCGIIDNLMKCWGDNSANQLGNKVVTTNSVVPVGVFNQGALQLKSKHSHGCFLQDGTIMCWGDNSNDQLGINDSSTAGLTAPGTKVYDSGGVDSVDEVMQVETGDGFSCLRKQGGAQCWGLNDSGQLGDNTTDSSLLPVEVLFSTDSNDKLKGVTQIALGNRHACAIIHTNSSSVGEVKCWGENSNGKLGINPTTSEVHFATTITGTPFATIGVQLVAGLEHTCALDRGGTVTCWGDNSKCQLGDGGACGGSNYIPSTVTGITNAIQIASGDDHTCALLTDTTVKCWGYNQSKQLGLGTLEPPTTPHAPQYSTPYTVKTASDTLSGVIQVSAGDAHVCAALNTGEVNCWGWNGYGQVGNNNNPPYSYARTVYDSSTSANLANGIITSAGERYSCAFLSTGEAKCWGSDANGRLGNGDVPSSNQLSAGDNILP